MIDKPPNYRQTPWEDGEVILASTLYDRTGRLVPTKAEGGRLKAESKRQ
jgi:hypothetical protein